MIETYRMLEVTVDLVRMKLRKGGGGTRKEDERAMPARSEAFALSKTNSRRKRKADKDAGDLRRQMLDQAEKRARIEVLAMLGLSEEVSVEVKKENLRSQPEEKPSDRGGKVEEDVEENLLMEMQDIFNDLHDLS